MTKFSGPRTATNRGCVPGSSMSLRWSSACGDSPGALPRASEERHAGVHGLGAGQHLPVPQSSVGTGAPAGGGNRTSAPRELPNGPRERHKSPKTASSRFARKFSTASGVAPAVWAKDLSGAGQVATMLYVSWLLLGQAGAGKESTGIPKRPSPARRCGHLLRQRRDAGISSMAILHRDLLRTLLTIRATRNW